MRKCSANRAWTVRIAIEDARGRTTRLYDAEFADAAIARVAAIRELESLRWRLIFGAAQSFCCTAEITGAAGIGWTIRLYDQITPLDWKEVP
jgi:hypothetical protein